MLTSRGFVVDAGLAGAVLPCAPAVAVGGATEVGGVRVTGGGAAILQGELRPAPPIIPHTPRADHTWGSGACVRQQQGPGGGCGHRVRGGVNIVTVPATVTIGLTTRGERGTKQPHVCIVVRSANEYLHVITLGRPSAGRQVTRAALPVLPGVLAHDARDEDHGRDQGEAPHRVCVETGHQHTAAL